MYGNTWLEGREQITAAELKTLRSDDVLQGKSDYESSTREVQNPLKTGLIPVLGM